MCGIAGIVNLSRQPVDLGLLAAMNSAMRHRGPDDEGYVVIKQGSEGSVQFSGQESPADVRDRYPLLDSSRNRTGGNIGLAHRRYAIIDLTSGGHQPFFDHHRQCCVVFNGEIYNYVEVREELESRGSVFHTDSDTEAIVEGYKAWGTECFKHLNGMWALALYDFQRHTLLLSRDRMGKRPLYWTRVENTIVFASEIKALFQVPAIERTRALNEAVAYPYLTRGLRDLDDTTFFAGISSLPAGTWSAVDGDFPGNSKRYWQIPNQRLKERDISIEEASAQVRERLTEAVRIRLRADVPWAVQLSGGMDSSALVALASQLTGKTLTTYTVSFPGTEKNEEPFARSVAKLYQTDYRVVESPLQNFWHEARPFTFLEEEPYHGPGLHSAQITFRMMRAAGTKMLLNGGAGDELFAGYGRYFFTHQIESFRSGRLGNYLNNGLHWSEKSSLTGPLVDPILLLVKRTARRILSGDAARSDRYRYIKLPFCRLDRDFETLTEHLYSDLTNTRMPYWLCSEDKTIMGVPIEERSPFLDYQVVELAASLPETFLIRNGWHKWILRKALEDVLPPDVVWRRKKMGFPFPLGRFLERSQSILEIIWKEAANPYIDFAAIEKSNRSPIETWRLVSFLLWYEAFFNENDRLFTQLADASDDPSVDYGFAPEFMASSPQLPSVSRQGPN